MVKQKRIGSLLLNIFIGVVSSISIECNFTLPRCDFDVPKPNDRDVPATCDMKYSLPLFIPTSKKEDNESQTEKVDKDKKS